MKRALAAVVTAALFATGCNSSGGQLDIAGIEAQVITDVKQVCSFQPEAANIVAVIVGMAYPPATPVATAANQIAGLICTGFENQKSTPQFKASPGAPLNFVVQTPTGPVEVRGSLDPTHVQRFLEEQKK